MEPDNRSHALATQGAKTGRGGEVVSASTVMEVEKNRIASVGDEAQA